MIAFFLVSVAAFLLVPTRVYADNNEDLQKIIWQGKLEWQNSLFTGKNLKSNMSLSRGSPVQHTENIFEATVEYNEDIARVEMRTLEYEFMELSFIKLPTQQSEKRHMAALQLLFVGIETSNVGEYLSVVVPVLGVLPEDLKIVNPKLERCLQNLGRENAKDRNVYVDSLDWLESVLKKGFVNMDDNALIHPSLQIYDQLFMSNVEFVSDYIIAQFYKSLSF